MKITRVFGAIALTLAGLTVQAQGLAIPAYHDSLSVFDDHALAFSRKCMPLVTDTDVHQWVLTSGNTNTITSRSKIPGKGYIGVSKGKIYCVHMSTDGFPIIPRSFYEGTISFPGMEPDVMDALRTDMSQQLAMKGFSHAWVLNEQGNAVEVLYFIDSSQPTFVHYIAHFVKKDDLPSPSLQTPYHTVGGVRLNSRGSVHEQLKSLFEE